MGADFQSESGSLPGGGNKAFHIVSAVDTAQNSIVRTLQPEFEPEFLGREIRDASEFVMVQAIWSGPYGKSDKVV